jgi:hypothetical protein
VLVEKVLQACPMAKATGGAALNPNLTVTILHAEDVLDDKPLRDVSEEEAAMVAKRRGGRRYRPPVFFSTTQSAEGTK